MIKYICDICKKEVISGYGYHENYISIGENMYGGGGGFDVCTNCREKIERHAKEFLNGLCEVLNNINEND